jgi:hypothetical protein
MNESRWRFLSSLFCLISLGVITFQWNREVGDYVPHGEQLVDQALVNEVLGAHGDPEDRIRIPTGVFVQSLAFVSADDVNITGYIWQKYDPTIPESKLSRGFVLPERVISGDTVVEEAYRRESGGVETIGWYFDVTVRQPFDYSRYPLDSHVVWIRLWHKDFDRNVVLVPDFAAYEGTSTAKGEEFGLDDTIVPGGWNIDETFFDYRPSNYDTNFGIDDYVGQTDFPELHFSVSVTRTFTDVFIINLVPLIVVAVLLYSVLVTTTGDPKQSERFGFSAASAIGTASALFFVVMLAHIALREQFAGSGLVYLEEFYLTIYAAIVLVSVNVYLFSKEDLPRWLRFIKARDNAVIKIAYWPIMLGTLAINSVL